MIRPLVYPERLRAGDRVAAVSPSSGLAAEFPHRYRAGKEQLQKEFGLEVIEMPSTLKDSAWLHANPEARAADLMAAFRDPSIRAIIATIGGDDSIRLLPFLSLDTIRENPKIVMGFSDNTVTHFVCRAAGLVTFYGPMFLGGFAENGGMFPYLVDSVRANLFSTEAIGDLPQNLDGWTDEFLDWANPQNQQQARKLHTPLPWRFHQSSGAVRGKLIGGSAEVLEFLKGTSLWPSVDQWKDSILCLETAERMTTPTHLQWYLRNYAAQGILQELQGLLVGRPGGGIDVAQFADYDNAVLRVVREECGLHDLAVVTCMDFGHTAPQFTLPLGVQAEIDSGQERVAILESGVR